MSLTPARPSSWSISSDHQCPAEGAHSTVEAKIGAFFPAEAIIFAFWLLQSFAYANGTFVAVGIPVGDPYDRPAEIVRFGYPKVFQELGGQFFCLSISKERKARPVPTYHGRIPSSRASRRAASGWERDCRYASRLTASPPLSPVAKSAQAAVRRLVLKEPG